MQKKDYILLADALRAEGHDQHSKTVATIALALFAENPAFDEKRFYERIAKPMENEEIDRLIDDWSSVPHVADARQKAFKKILGN